MYENTIKSRKFSERGFLEFSFDTGEKPATGEIEGNNGRRREPTSTDLRNFKVTMPFYENPTISEGKQARLGKYKPIGRNSNLYSFLGADSRTLTLSFNLTLPHLSFYLESHAVETYTKTFISFGQRSNEIEKSRFFSKAVTTETLSEILRTIRGFEDQYNTDFETFTEPNTGVLPGPTTQTPGQSPRNAILENQIRESKVKALYYFWTNIIRCSVIGTSDHRSAPPVVRLSFGPLYKRVPFIVEKYQIQVENNAGFDVSTLLPNRIKITLNMEELRVGNFGDYAAFSFNNGQSLQSAENVAGWEYIMDTGSLDPLHYPLGGT